ncbi:hypothetical protein FSP39_019668 [Pinctada imbricata]|uniref:Uncharacterized protein n=1 Tax=Pinctada imbricata TaxID=66713 RepID=A0AA89CCA0_PINIB|nr:hypothetical protein FSP39_019668 [Pinctada imbricata]
MALRCIFFLSVVFAFVYISEGGNQGNNVLLARLKQQEERGLEPYSVEKRGWGSVILYSTALLVRTTSVGLTLAAALTEGCSYYRSICRDRDAIEALDKEIQEMKVEFDDMYKNAAQEWVDLRYVSTNNGYINFYVDEVVRQVQNLSDLQTLIVDELKLNVPKIFEMYQASQSLTSAMYLDTLIGGLELQLSDISKMLEGQRNNALLGLVAQLMVESTLNSFINSYRNAYKQIRTTQKLDAELDAIWTAVTKADPSDSAILMDPKHPKYEQVMKKYGLKSSKISNTGQVKMAPQVMTKMFQNAKKAGSDSLGKLSTWDKFKGTVKTKLSSASTKLSKTKAFFTSSASRKYQVSNFKMSWSTKIMTGLGIIADAVMTAVEVAEWKKVADQLKKAKEEYEEYRDNLKIEIAKMKEEEANVTHEWNNNVDLFKEMSKAFDELIEKSSNASDFTDVIGLPQSAVSSNNPLLKIDFDAVNKASLADAQDVVMNFLKEIDLDLRTVVDRTRALYTLYNNVRIKAEADEIITEIQGDLSDIFNFNPSKIVRDFGNQLQKKDIVCTIAIVLPQVSEYDHFQLAPFRPDCNVSSSEFSQYETQALRDRNKGLMRTVVKQLVGDNSEISLSSLHGNVQNAYLVSKHQAIVDFGKSISEQDVVCVVAQEFPSMKSYSTLDLDSFRPSCDAVSSAQFLEMKKSADRINSLLAQVQSSMSYCDSFSFCPCLDLMASSYGASEGEIKTAIKVLKPTLKEYCGTTGCSCVQF